MYAHPRSVTSVTTVTKSLKLDNNLKEHNEIPDLKSLLTLKQKKLNQSTDKVKCPHCSYEEDPFYLKVHVKNEHGIGVEPEIRDSFLAKPNKLSSNGSEFD